MDPVELSRFRARTSVTVVKESTALMVLTSTVTLPFKRSILYWIVDVDRLSELMVAWKSWHSIHVSSCADFNWV